jgi:hypothetical protein
MTDQARMMFDEPVYFDGKTYDPTRDKKRLQRQLYRVWALMSDGNYRSLRTIADAVGASEGSVAARLRDYRKERFGKHRVDRLRLVDGLFVYRVIPRWGLEA